MLIILQNLPILSAKVTIDRQFQINLSVLSRFVHHYAEQEEEKGEKNRCLFLLK